MTEFPRNKLEKALQDAADDPVARPDFFNLLLDAQIYVIGEADSGLPEEDFRIREGDTLSLASFEFEDGRPYIPFFTSLEALTETVVGETGYLSIRGRELLESTRGNYLVLNPGQEIAKEFTPGEVTRLLDGTRLPGQGEYTLAENTEVQLGPPVDIPVEMVEALTRLFARHSTVRRAFLTQMRIPERDDDPLSLLVALETDGKTDAVLRAMEIVIASTAAPERPVDAVLLGNGSGFVDQYIAESGIEPFYARSWGQRLKGFFVRP